MTNLNIPHVDRVVKGIEIIRKYTTDTWITAEHDVIYFGAHETIEQMTEEERKLMAEYGWLEDSDAWCIFT